MLTLQLQSINLRSPSIDLKTGLLQSPTLTWVPVEVNSLKAKQAIAEAAPVDGVEVVEWMQMAAADNAVFEAMAEEYNRLGSNLVSGSGDAYIPGIRVGDLRGESVAGSYVQSRGYGVVITPAGNYRVPVGGKLTIASGNILGWAAIPWASSVQWQLTLLQWRDLATAPVRDRVRFGSSQGLVAPNFFSVAPRIPSPLMVLRIGLTSDKEQTVAIRGRGVKGSFENILFEDSFKVSSGASETICNVVGFPFVGQFTLELQPSDGTETVLDYIEVFP
jgi:hypothetical protein